MKCFAHRDDSGYRLFLFKETSELSSEIMQAAVDVIYSPKPTAKKIEQAVRKIVPDANIEVILNDYGVTWQVKIT